MNPHFELFLRMASVFALVALGLYLLAWADGPGEQRVRAVLGAPRRMVLRALQRRNKRRVERAMQAGLDRTWGGKR